MKRLVCIAIAAGCGPADLSIDSIESTLDADERRARCEAIRDTARDRGLTNGVLLGGIGDAETNLAHCWSEATWACQGPDSTSCGGPVIAGAGDGPCNLQQGGLGLFQFDGGTFDQTLARDGEEILLLEGNISHAVDFVIGMVLRSDYVGGVTNADEAIAWMNQIPIELGNPDYEAWVSTVTHYYNGCQPTFGCWDERRGRYDSLTRGVYDEMGPDFWMAPEPAPCAALPPEGGTIEENDPCYDDGGPSSGWRTVEAGHGGRLRWTFAFDQPTENFGVWNLDLAAEGMFRVEVYTEPEYAQTRRARYTVEHAGTTEVVVFDQSAAAGFQVLGDFFFAAGGGQSIRLEDSTGEPLSDQRRIAFDAIRATRVEVDPDPDPDPPLTLAPTPVLKIDPIVYEAKLDGTSDMMTSEEGGCVCVRPTGAGDPARMLVFVLVLGFIRARKLARSPAPRERGER